jgi:hypothetical protein
MNTSNQSSESSTIFDNWIVKFSKFYETFQIADSELLIFLIQALVKGLKTANEEFNEVREKLTVVDYAFLMANLCAVGCALLVVFSGFGVLGYQLALWLQEGVWTELPLLTVFNYFFEGAAIQGWVNSPQSWFGLHQVVDWCLQNIPLSLTLIFEGMLLVTFTGCFLFLSIVFRYIWIKRF